MKTLKEILTKYLSAGKPREGKRISYKERREDALVHGAEEGRDKLRKATGSRK